jgi:O-methyltransferase involved in polyketide biosynthesis
MSADNASAVIEARTQVDLDLGAGQAASRAAKLSLKNLKGIPETLLIPLRCRYLETKRADGLIRDIKSVEVIDALDHDFAAEELPWDCQIMVVARTEIIDEATQGFIEDNPDGIIVNLGCGLDTRADRLDNGKALWFELDLPECIEIRERFFEQSDRVRFIAKSVLDSSWVDEIPRDRKVLFIAEGLLNYLSQEHVKQVLVNIRDNFPDSELVCEVFSMLLARTWHKHPHIRNAYSHFKWGASSGRAMEKWAKGIRFVEEWFYFDRFPQRWGWLRFLRLIPPFHKVMKVVRLRFGLPAA